MNNDFLKPKKIKKPADDDTLLNQISKDNPGPAPELDNEGRQLLKEQSKKEISMHKKHKRRSPKQWFKDLTKKQKIIFWVVLFVVLTGSGGGVYALLNKSKPVAPVVEQKKVEEPPKPTTEPSKLTGVEVPIGTNNRPVTGVMIENSPDARPQSGLNSAGVVFEAIAEGGITRFLTLFQEAQPEYIGPVRSVRPYYLDWLQGFDAPIAHAGGSGDGLAKIKTDGVRDLDQFANASAFNRVDSRYAPHNLYTSMAKLDELNKSKGFTSSTFEGFARKAEKAETTPTAKTIDFTISSSLYNPHYDYDAATNSYKRSEGGKPHTDEKSGAQISPKVVIANIITYGIASNGVNSTYNTIGSGKSYIFQDGSVIEGTWNKTSSKSQMVFKDANGIEIKLNPGQTWISAVGAANGVKYTP